jgi:putative sigma-54 modulation protein
MTQMVVKGKNIDVPEPLHRYVEKKLGKMDKYLEKITAITVQLSAEPRKSSNNRQVVEVTMVVNGQTLRAEDAAADMFAAVDAVVEKLERSVARYKDKFYRKSDIRRTRREAARTLNETIQASSEVEETPGDEAITHTKHFQIKPMSPAEATDQMELLGHDFYIFYNQDTAGVSVVYKRKNGTYGLLIPELA